MTKTIALSESAYRKLKQRKGKGESFSDVILRLSGQIGGASLLALKGSWSGDDLEKVRRVLAADRESAEGRELRL